ncbi:hypothetical protein [Halorubrum sp. F4]|uniref:hypothetical protein n=1 Tax=Halorubrum sp. F4 TaxID=2989715 RepID=UPI002480622C|nr:hypothetical protein [Halorubrum sp. F4]
MTDPAPIPPDEFADALDSLDPDDLVAFVAELWAATGEEVDADPPVVTVRNGGSRTDLVVAPAASDAVREAIRAGDVDDPRDGDSTADPDAVVLPDEGSVSPDADLETVSADDLRGRLLYALPVAEAESACERFLGMPARSESYDRRSGDQGSGGRGSRGRGSTEGNGATAGVVGDRTVEDRAAEDRVVGDRTGEDPTTKGPIATDRPTGSASTAPEPTASSSRPNRGVAADRAAPGEERLGSDDGTVATAASDDGAAGSRRHDPDVRRGRLATAVVVVVLLAAVAGAASVTGPSLSGGVGDRLDPGNDPPSTGEEDTVDDGEGPGGSSESSSSGSSESSSMDSTGSVDLGNSGTYTGVTDSFGSFDDAGATDRNGSAAERATALEPTCERGPLHVVQIQMNALRYNDPETNDGIRTTRRFASPRNRQVVSTFGQFVDLFEGTNYAPMLTHDAVWYAPLGIDDDRATVRVVTYENGSATAEYEFRMRKVNATAASFTGGESGYDGCWMTDAVSVVSTGDSNGTDGGNGAADSNEPVEADGTTEDPPVHGPPGT